MMLRSKVWSLEPSALSDSDSCYQAELKAEANLGDEAPVPARLIAAAAAAGAATEAAGERR